MKITESKLRQMIRGVIREFVSTGTATGAKKGGYKSADTKSKEATYDAKKSAYDTKTAAYNAFDASKKYRRVNKSGGYDYRSDAMRGWEQNPEYTTVSFQKAAANRAKDTAKDDWNQAQEDDLQAEVPSQEPPTGGGKGGFGKGKSAGKGKGKKKN